MPNEKIINRTISFFELSIPRRNKYIILLPDSSPSSTKVDIGHIEMARAVRYDSDIFWSEIGNVEAYEKVVIHFLSYDAARFVNRIKHNNIYWIEWGADLYNSFLYRRGYKIYNDEKLIVHSRYPYLNFRLYKILHQIFTYKQYKECYKAIRKIKYFVPDSMYDEYPLFINYYPEFSHLTYKEFFYYPIDDILGDLYYDSRVNGNNVLIGNSCSYTNNHPYVLDYLYHKGIDSHLIVPLSYAGDDQYRQTVINKGEMLFGNKFCPILDFMSLDSYNKLLLSCNSFIFGNLRQEAVGNILIALYIGGRVFLQSDNPLLHFYKSLGLIIYSFDDINGVNLIQKMDVEAVNNNKRILDNMYSSQRMRSLIVTTFAGDDD